MIRVSWIDIPFDRFKKNCDIQFDDIRVIYISDLNYQDYLVNLYSSVGLRLLPYLDVGYIYKGFDRKKHVVYGISVS